MGLLHGVFMCLFFIERDLIFFSCPLTLDPPTVVSTFCVLTTLPHSDPYNLLFFELFHAIIAVEIKNLFLTNKK